MSIKKSIKGWELAINVGKWILSLVIGGFMAAYAYGGYTRGIDSKVSNLDKYGTEFNNSQYKEVKSDIDGFSKEVKADIEELKKTDSDIQKEIAARLARLEAQNEIIIKKLK